MQLLAMSANRSIGRRLLARGDGVHGLLKSRLPKRDVLAFGGLNGRVRDDGNDVLQIGIEGQVPLRYHLYSHENGFRCGGKDPRNHSHQLQALAAQNSS